MGGAGFARSGFPWRTAPVYVATMLRIKRHVVDLWRFGVRVVR
jgi:hypothetical protein